MAVLTLEQRARLAWVADYWTKSGGGKWVDEKGANEIARVFNGTCGFDCGCPGGVIEGLRDRPALTLLRLLLCGEEGTCVPSAGDTITLPDGTVIVVPPEGSSGPTAPAMLTTCGYGVISGETVTNSGPTVINGSLALHPGSSITGAPVVTGATEVNTPAAIQAKTDLTAVYNDLQGRPGGVLIGPDVSGITLTPGIYRSTSTLDILSSNLTLDAQGNSAAVWIFQIASGLNVSNGRAILLTNGAQAGNVYFAVGSSAVIGSTVLFKGRIIALTSTSLGTGASVEGGVQVQNGSVTLLSNNIVASPC